MFSHNGNWLHPLFALEEYMAGKELNTADLVLRDKIIGKAAAMLIFRMGFRSVRAGIISRPAVAYLQERNVNLEWDNLVDHIACKTEEIYVNRNDADKAWAELKVRAGLA